MRRDNIELPAFPWVWHQQGDANDHVFLTSGNQWVIAFRTNGEFMPEREKAIIRHLVASANACAGISAENLEDNIPIKELATRYNKALRQRDRLLSALEKAVGRQAYRPGSGPDWWEESREIIAGVKSGESAHDCKVRKEGEA